MTEIVLRMGQPLRSFRIVPNEGDVTVENVATAVNGGVSGDAFVALGPYASEPGNPLAFSLAPLAPTTVPSVLNYSFDSNTEDGVQMVMGSVPITVLPVNATGAEVVEIV